MPTLADYKQELADRLMAGRDAQRGTATAGTTTLLTCTAVFQSTLGTTSKHKGDWISVTDTSGGVTAEAIIASVNATTGEITLDRTIAFDIDSGDTFLLTGPFRPSVLKNAVNAVLRNSFMDTMYPMGFHVVPNDDNDMESALTTAWGVTGAAGETASKATTPFGPLAGYRILSATSDFDANEYLDLVTPIPVHAGDSLWASIFARVDSATETLRLDIWDVTNNALIESIGSCGEKKWVEISDDFTVPSGCKEINVRFVMPSGGTPYVDDFAIEGEDELLAAPSWLTREAQMIDCYELIGGETISGNVSRVHSSNMRPIAWSPSIVQMRGGQRLILDVPPFSGHRRYIAAKRPGENLSADTDEGFVPLDNLVEAALPILEMAKKGESAAPYLREIRMKSLLSSIDRPVAKAVAAHG